MRDALPITRAPAVLALALLVACGDATTLPPPTVPNTTVVVTLYAMTGTPVNTPSAFSMLDVAERRTDQGSDYDFVFEIGPANALGADTTADTVAVLMPRAALGFTPDGGFQAANAPFDSLAEAPAEGYDQERPVIIGAGDVFFVTGRRQSCDFTFASPRYGKLRVEEVDFALRRAVLRVLVDSNCGYRGLLPGLPPR